MMLAKYKNKKQKKKDTKKKKELTTEELIRMGKQENRLVIKKI